MDITKIKLYHYPATRSARVKWMLHELVGDAFETEIVSLYEGDQYSAAYLKKNPNHSVPTLELTLADGRSMHMIESGAMVALLADAYPEKQLSPPPGELFARADYLQMLHFGTTWMDMMLWQIRLHEHLLPEAERDPATIARYRRKFTTEAEPQLHDRLCETPFICGPDFCAADCVIAHNVYWARTYGMCRALPFKQYLSRVSKRPAFISAFSDARDFNLKRQVATARSEEVDPFKIPT